MSKNYFSNILKASLNGRELPTAENEQITPETKKPSDIKKNKTGITIKKNSKPALKSNSYYLEVRVHEELKRVAKENGWTASELLNDILKQVFGFN